MPEDSRESFSEKIPGWLAAVILCLLGVALWAASPLLNCGRWSELFRSLAEALVIAGILSVFVDPFVKNRLLKESARGLFVHMLGFDHQPEVKTRLQQIAFDTKLFMQDKRIDCTITRTQSKRVLIDVQATGNIRNPTIGTLKYKARLAFEQSENPIPDSVSINVLNDNASETVSGLTKDEDEPGVLRAESKEMDVSPRSQGIIITSKYSLNLPEIGCLDFAVFQPVIGTTLTVKAPTDMEVHASGGFNAHNSDGWRWNGIFMPSERITLRWFPRVPPEKAQEPDSSDAGLPDPL
jgi:hypothetical protein